MKVYNISRTVFWVIFFLILILPVSRQWRLFSSGVKTRGTVTAYEICVGRNLFGQKEAGQASRVEFTAGDSLVAVHGPFGEHLAAGRKVVIYYDPGNPGRFCMLTFGGLYLNDYSSLVLFLLVVWGAFYLSFNRYRKKARAGSRLPASSPYRKTGRPRRPAGKHPKNQGRLPGNSS